MTTKKKVSKKKTTTKKEFDMPKLEYIKLREDAINPTGEYVLDICCPYDVKVNALQNMSIDTGLAFKVPKGYELRIRADLGLLGSGKLRSISPVHIRHGDESSLRIPVENNTPNIISTNDNIFNIQKGTKIAEAVLEKLWEFDISESE